MTTRRFPLPWSVEDIDAVLVVSRVQRLATPRVDETKDQGEQNREDNRCHDREINTNISVRTLIFDVTWKK